MEYWNDNQVLLIKPKLEQLSISFLLHGHAMNAACAKEKRDVIIN